jgi:hypothetical protein
MKFFKSLTIWLIILGLNAANIACVRLFSDTLKDAQLKNIHLCENTKTGVARYSFNLLQTASTIRESGIKFEALMFGDEIILEFGQAEKLEMSLSKIDAGDLKKYPISCYEAQELKTSTGDFNRQDKTLNITTISAMEIFGYLQPTEKDKALAQEKRDRTNAKRHKYLKLIEDFEKKSKIHRLKDEKISASELILTDEVLDDLVILLDNLEAEIPAESTDKMKYLRREADILYELYEPNKRLKRQHNIAHTSPQYYFYGDKYQGYKTWSELTKENIRRIKK